MIKRLHHENQSVGIVIEDEDGDESLLQFCSTCAANGEMSRLKERIWLDDKTGKRLPDPPDADQFKMCWVCGLIIRTKDIKLSGKISGIAGVEAVENAYDVGKGVITGIDSRLSSRVKKLKRRQTKHPDKEIQKYIDDGFSLLAYQQDTIT